MFSSCRTLQRIRLRRGDPLQISPIRLGFTHACASVDGSARIPRWAGCSEEIDTEARPRAVWEIVSDINMPTRFQQFVGADRLTDGEIEVGSIFKGRNSIQDGEIGKPIASLLNGLSEASNGGSPTDKPGAMAFRNSRAGAGSRLRFSMTIGRPCGTAPRALRDPYSRTMSCSSGASFIKRTCSVLLKA